ARKNPANDNRQRTLDDDGALENQVCLFGRDRNERMRDYIQRVIEQREERSPEGDRSRRTAQGINGVLEPVPVAAEGIGKISADANGPHHWPHPLRIRAAEVCRGSACVLLTT